jgi:O-antigen ligase
MVWQSALELIRQHPLGVGTGDVKDELVKRYEIHGFKKPLEKKLNAHSQWLQSSVALGWPGMLFLSLPFLLMALILYRKFTWLGAVFLGLTGFNFLVESMLEVQAGVIPFVFFMFFFLHRPGEEEPELV